MNKLGDIGSQLADPGSLITSIKDDIKKETTKAPLETVEKVEEQAGTKHPKDQDQQPDNNAQPGRSDPASKEATRDVIKKMYESSDVKPSSTPVDATIESAINENPTAKIQDIQEKITKLHQFKQQLHKSSYYDQTFNRVGKKQEEQEEEQEEKEKEEREKKQMEEIENQEEREKKAALAPTVKQGSHEKNPGASG